jgi:hypothetical protein
VATYLERSESAGFQSVGYSRCFLTPKLGDFDNDLCADRVWFADQPQILVNETQCLCEIRSTSN